MESQELISIAAFTGGVNVPSARFRVRQYIPELGGLGVEMTEFPARLGAYPPVSKLMRPWWALGTLSSRLTDVFNSYHFHVTVLQRELLSTYLTLEPLTKSPRVLDVDDAIWLYRDGEFARRLAQLSNHVICGNRFIAEFFGQWNQNITILPTAVDTIRYRPLPRKPDNDCIIGWSGTSGGLVYLYEIELALASVLQKNPRARLRIVSDKEPRFKHIPAHKCEYIRWSPQSEVQAVQEIDIGIMPLEDSLWARGKCSYKMLLYMACGVPVVVSPIGMNREVLELGNVGFGATSLEAWESNLGFLLTNREQAIEMGRTGRNVVLRHFSIQFLAAQFARVLRSVALQNR